MRRILPVLVILSTACGGARLNAKVQELTDPNIDTRISAARYLINNGGAKLFPRIVEVLNDDFPENRLTAVYCLAHLKDPRAIPHFVKMADEDKDKLVRQTAVDALGLYGSKGVEALNEILSPGHKADVRARAVEVLGNLGDPGVFEPLLTLAQKETAPDEVRASAAWRLGCLKDRRAEQILSRILDDEGYPSRVRCGAAFGLVGLYMLTEDHSMTLPLMNRLRGGAHSADVRACAARSYFELSEPTNLAGFCKIGSFLEVPTLSEFNQ